MWSLFLKHGISEVSYKCSVRLLHFGWTRIKACLSTLQPFHSLSVSQQRLFDRLCLLAAYSPIKDPKGTTMKTSGSPLVTQILPFWYLAPQILDPSSSLNSELLSLALQLSDITGLCSGTCIQASSVYSPFFEESWSCCPYCPLPKYSCLIYFVQFYSRRASLKTNASIGWKWKIPPSLTSPVIF